MERQQLFYRKPVPNLGFVIEENTLTRPLGGPLVLKEQLHHILDVGQLRHVEIQVMPHNRETHAGLMGPRILLETAERRQLAYIEGHKGGYFVSEQPDLGDLFGGEEGECVEVATCPATIHVRDSKNPQGLQLTLAPEAWSPFLTATEVLLPCQ
jgi:hypothetical protein